MTPWGTGHPALDAFLATAPTANPNMHRAYASAIDRTIALLVRVRALADLADLATPGDPGQTL
ncbi:hypothetical protein [Nonomuraea sp. NPDC052265]|uniref:hypothetical protein n=1 Tax=Nonomuraea sp. NPDC052265 TaxID=3364374 RepID=UPI0037CC9E3A